jgi:hypothetical protein
MSEDYNTNEDILDSLEQEEEMPFTDKLTGIFTAPGKTMEQVAKHQPKGSNWLIPIIIFIIISGLAAFLYNSNPVLKSEMEAKGMEALEKSYKDKVVKGEITQQQADEQKEKIMSQMQTGGSITIISQIVGIAIFTFITFFLVNLIFFALIKFVLKGDGNLSSALSAYGLSYYILILQTIITIILSLAFNKFYVGLSLGNFFNADWMTFSGFLLRKVDPFLIWFYIVLGISYAKMFKSENTKKYIILSLSVWILGNLLLYYLSTLSTYFSGFAM